jgi:DNA integrity scanning protein DisA with diadenylate cyclase activity
MELISRWIADLILFTGRQAQTFWGNLTLLNFSWQQAALDILLVAVLFYFFLLLIRGSRAVHILTGLLVVALIYWTARVMQLVTLGWILDRFLTIVLVAIPVIFQQELRMALERLGHTKIFMNQRARQISRSSYSDSKQGPA